MPTVQEASAMLGHPEQTVRDYLDRTGAGRNFIGTQRSLSSGDLIRIEAALFLKANGYLASTACRLVAIIASEFERIALDDSTKSWLVWRPAADDVEIAATWIVRSPKEAMVLMDRHEDAFLLPIHSILKAAMLSVLSKVQADA